jgi:predicted DsbA family dithiol-disulfide isomerase
MELALLHPNQKSDMGSYIHKFAARFGIHDMVRTTRLPNTRRVLALTEYARDQGKLTEFRSHIMNAHWKEGKDIEDTAVLRSLAAASGLDPEKALLAADDPVYLKRVDDARHEFKKVGTGGIPTFIFGTEVIEGCAPYEDLAAAARRAGARPKSQPQK